ncbi:PREDICTED: xyloglucan-specific galacturonosyltransferase 1-like [Tarenaya hassleriana]|uniref:xyloglucan-specific galacturonosyltransferase 1-like n=1 Tax=Tarenaya hassleriana TaxID=28532 RepID=UPI00053CA234|nr:PREDICTED: xyloglucan-specific galacturonosyltransferase 1-like [Tarenaya hassleriana]
MAVSVSKRRLRSSKKTELEKEEKHKGHHRILCSSIQHFCSSFCKSILFRIPLAVLLLFIVYLWSSSSTVVSSNVVHICISSRDGGTAISGAGKTKYVQKENLGRVLDRDNKTVDVPKENLGSVVDQDHKKDSGESRAKNENLDLWEIESGEEEFRYIDSKNEDEESALKALSKYLQLQRSWLVSGIDKNNIDDKSGSCKGKGIYVYDLPSKFNKDLLGQCSDMVPWTNFCNYFKNDALGEPMENLGKGWYRTHQYSLEPIFHSRFLKHQCRVFDENQAKLFYVPFYGGLDVLRWHFKNVSEDVKDSLGIEVIKWLGSKQSWKRNAGKDHVFVLGKISWDFRRNDKFSWGSRFLELQEMQNPTKLLIERHPWQINDIAVPHPTYFHPQTDNDIANWQIKIITKPRRSLVSFAGAARPGKAESIRSTIIDQCKSFPDEKCRFLNCSDGGCEKPETIIDMFQESEFCLQPPGDSPTRKSVFDSLVSGCIPVMFDPYSAYYQYTWHLPEDHRRYSVYISKEEVKGRGVNVVEKLMERSAREREDMRSYIVYELLPALIYGHSDSKFQRFRDAFDISISGLLEKIGN